MKKTNILITLSLAAVFGCLTLSAQQSITSKTTADEGVKTTVFQTPYGTLNVNVPDDMSDSDTISGTVIAEPAGTTEEEKDHNQDILSGYVVDVKPKSDTKPKHCNLSIPDFSCTIPDTCSAISVVLLGTDQKTICNNDMPCLPKPPTLSCPPDQAILPKKGTCGKPIKIKGKCDGKFDNSSVTIGKKKCRMLAESPRQQVCLTPIDVIGTTQIESVEGPRHVSGIFENLPAPKPQPAAKQPAMNLSGPWMMTGTAEGHASTMPVTISHQGNNVNWQCEDTNYSAALSGNTIQFTMSGTYWTGSGTLTLDPSASNLTGACNYTYKSGRAAPAVMTIQMSRTGNSH